MDKTAIVRRIDRVARDTLLVDLAMHEPAELDFQSGQFITIDAGTDRGGSRAYSVASRAARKDGFELIVKLVGGGLASRRFSGLHPGDELAFSGPRGFFTLLRRHPGDVVFAVTGVGIAAALPLVGDLLARTDERGRVLFFWGVREQRDLFFTDRLAELEGASDRFELHVCLTKPDAGWRGVHGRILDPILAALPSLEQPTFYAVGNGSMTQALTKALVERGIDRRRQIRTEQFYPVDEP